MEHWLVMLTIESIVKAIVAIVIVFPMNLLLVWAATSVGFPEWAGWPDPSLKQMAVIAGAATFLMSS